MSVLVPWTSANLPFAWTKSALEDSRHARLKAYQSARSAISGPQIEALAQGEKPEASDDEPGDGRRSRDALKIVMRGEGKEDKPAAKSPAILDCNLTEWYELTQRGTLLTSFFAR
jgi:hypothetical protein